LEALAGAVLHNSLLLHGHKTPSDAAKQLVSARNSKPGCQARKQLK
jgi:hypothetical protein